MGRPVFGTYRQITLCLIFLCGSLFADPAPHFHGVVSELTQDLPHILRCWAHRYFDPIEQHSEFPRGMDGKVPVILVHGYLHDISGWMKFRDSLQEAGLGPIYVPRLTQSSGDIRFSADEIASVIHYVIRETGQDSVVLIGHSMGGIVAAYCAQHCVDPEAVKAVITIATPLQGTRLANLGFGKASQQMCHNSRFLKKLTSQMNRNPKTEYFCLGSIQDEAVKPYKNAFYKTPDDPAHFRLYSDVGHQSFLYDDDVIDDVISMIDALDDSGGGDHSKMLVWFRKPFG